MFDYKCFIFDIWNELPLMFDYKCFIFDIWNELPLIFDYKCFIFDIWNELPLIFDYKCFIFDIWNAIVVILFITSILLFHLHYFKMIKIQLIFHCQMVNHINYCYE